MASITFVDQETIVPADWLNEVDGLVHDVFSAASTVGEARTALGLSTTDSVTFGDVTATSLTGTLLTAAQPNVTSVGTLLNFTSTGIDDNATSTAITIDASENTTFGGNIAASGSIETTGNSTSTNLIINGRSHFTSSNSHFKLYSTGSADTNDYFIIDNNATEFRILGYDSSATTFYSALESDLTGNITFGGDVSLGDNKIVYVGAGNDGRYYSDGVNTILNHESSAGALYIQSRTTSGLIRLRTYDSADATKECIQLGGATPNVRLYYNGSQRLETGAAGIYVTTDSTLSMSTFENTHATTPQGLNLDFSAGSPDNNTQWFLYCQDSTTVRARIYSDGDMWTSDAGTLTSDETLKTNIQDATSKLDDILALRVRNFEWKESYHPNKVGKKNIGFIAQEVEEIFPALISEHDISITDEPDMRKAIKDAFTPMIIKAIQEMHEDFNSRLNKLEGKKCH